MSDTVTLHFSGKLGPDGTRAFTRPIPFAIASMDEKNPMVVGKDRLCEATDAEAEYLLSLGGGFTLYVPEVPKPVMPVYTPEATDEACEPAPVTKKPSWRRPAKKASK